LHKHTSTSAITTSGWLNEELNADLASGPFAAYVKFTNDPYDTPPKVLITTSSQASKATYGFSDELVGVFLEYVRRKKGRGFGVGSRERVQLSGDCE